MATNVTFHIGTSSPGTSGLTTGGLYINRSSGGIYYATSATARSEVASKVSVTPSLTSGTTVGTISVNGSSKTLYCQDTLNTAGGTATNDKLFFVGMKSDNVASGQTYTNSYCYALGNYLYSNQLRCANLCSTSVSIDIPHSGNNALPIAKSETASYYITVADADIGGSFVGYAVGDFTSGYNGGSWSKTRLGVQIGTTETGGTASYRLGVRLTANSTLTNNQVAILTSGSIELTVYYIPYVNSNY